MTDTLTSGTDNNVGLGIKLASDDTWYCDNTLRNVPTYVSFRMMLLFIILSCMGVITFVSYFLPKFLYMFIKSVDENSKWWKLIGAPLISFTLHDVMHLYRIALESKSTYRFHGSLSTMPVYGDGIRASGGTAPNYGITAWEYHQLIRDEAQRSKYITQQRQAVQGPQDLEMEDLNNQALNDDASSTNQADNTELPAEVSPQADDNPSILTLRAANESVTEIVESVESGLDSDVDDEVEVHASSEDRPYVATMQVEPIVITSGRHINEVQ